MITHGFRRLLAMTITVLSISSPLPSIANKSSSNHPTAPGCTTGNTITVATKTATEKTTDANSTTSGTVNSNSTGSGSDASSGLSPTAGTGTDAKTGPGFSINSSAGPNTGSGTTTGQTSTSATESTTSATDAKKPSASELPDHITPYWGDAKPAVERPKDKPVEKPAPAGQEAAIKLYTARKFAPAALQFEKFVKDGTANAETHAYLAYCEYSLKHYTKALKQFNWVAKNCPDNYKLRTSAERSAALLQTQMAGICPNQCLKANDPRWQSDASGKRWIKWRVKGGSVSVSDAHLGQIWSVRNDQLVTQGVCPTCGGTGRLAPLKDGDPLPR